MTFKTDLYGSSGLRVNYAKTYAQPAMARGVMGVLFWLRVWLQYMCGLGPKQGFAPVQPRRAKRRANRHRRRMAAHMARNTLPSVRNARHFRAMLPRGLSHTQYQERESRVSIYGRVFIYRIPNVVPLHRRMLHMRLTHNWARAPFGPLLLSILAGLWIACLRPN